MKLYRTKNDNIINLEEMTVIDKYHGHYVVHTTSGSYDMYDLDKSDIEKIMQYNDYFIK